MLSIRERIQQAAAYTHRYPSEAQRLAGNYPKGSFWWNGREISIETPRGGIRSGTSRDGRDWSVRMPCHYGYLRRTLSAADGDAVDIMMGPHPESDLVCVVDQQSHTGRFDEHKAVLGCRSVEEARRLYLSCYSPGWKGLKSITPMTRHQFFAWLERGDTGRPIVGQVSRYAATSETERWITIGSHGEGEGGGVHVKIDGNGNIVGGPEGLAKKGIKSLNDFGKEEKPGKRFTAKGHEIYDSNGVRHAAFRNEEKAKAAAEDWNANGRPGEKKGDTEIANRIESAKAHIGSTVPPKASSTSETARPREDGSLPAMDAPKPTETPREAAERQQKALDKDYEFARESSVRNAGEDLKGSARHKRNAWRGLDEAEKNGTASELVTRDNLLKAEPHKLMDIASLKPIQTLAMHYAMRAFPAKPGYGDAKRRSRVSEDENKKDRSQFLDTYREYKAKAEELAGNAATPMEAVSQLREWVKGKIGDLRGRPKNLHPGDYMNNAGFNDTDKYNNTANALCDTLKSLDTGYRAQKNGVAANASKFVEMAKAKYGGELPDNETLVSHVQDVIEGRSVPDTLGQKKEGKKGFDASEEYVKHAVREGGRDVSAFTKDPNEAAAHILKKFGSRGVQWGNSVTDDERLHHAGKLVEALADLADVTGLKPEDLGLGKLGWAIGARGHGNASAHYEPGSQVINLTRKSGVGALAHEWGHAFDHSIHGFGISANNVSGTSDADYASERESSARFAKNPDGTYKHDNGKMVTEDFSKDPIWSSFAAVRKAWKESGYQQRLKESLRKLVDNGFLTKERAAKYWDSTREKFARTFERHVQHKLESEGRKNTYLAGLAGTGEDSLWPTEKEAAHLAPHFDALLAAYRQKKYGSEEPQKYSRFELMAAFRGMYRDRYSAGEFDESAHPRDEQGRWSDSWDNVTSILANSVNHRDMLQAIEKHEARTDHPKGHAEELAKLKGHVTRRAEIETERHQAENDLDEMHAAAADLYRAAKTDGKILLGDMQGPNADRFRQCLSVLQAESRKRGVTVKAAATAVEAAHLIQKSGLSYGADLAHSLRELAIVRTQIATQKQLLASLDREDTQHAQGIDEATSRGRSHSDQYSRVALARAQVLYARTSLFDEDDHPRDDESGQFVKANESKGKSASGSATKSSRMERQIGLFSQADLGGAPQLFETGREFVKERKSTAKKEESKPSKLEQISDELKANTVKPLPGQKELTESVEIPKRVRKHGIKSWEQARKKGVEALVKNSDATVRAAEESMRPVATRTDPSIRRAVAENLASRVLKQCLITGNASTAFDQAIDQISNISQTPWGDPMDLSVREQWKLAAKAMKADKERILSLSRGIGEPVLDKHSRIALARASVMRYAQEKRPVPVPKSREAHKPAPVPPTSTSGGGKKSGKSGWITLGGSHVHIGDDGKILHGCPGLKGENVDTLDENRHEREVRQDHAEARGLTGRDVTSAEAKRLSSTNRIREHAVAKDAARGSGHSTASVLRALPDAHAIHADQHTMLRPALNRAMKMTGVTPKQAEKWEDSGRDWSTWPEFDDMARVIAAEHPELGLDKSDHDTPARIWDMIRDEGKRTRQVEQHSPEVAQTAVEMLGAPRRTRSGPRGDAFESTGDTSFDPDKFSRVQLAKAGFLVRHR